MPFIPIHNYFISAAKEENSDLQLQLQSKSSLLEDLSGKNVDLETKIEGLEKEIEEQINEKGEVEKKFYALKSPHEKDKLEFEGNISNLEVSNILVCKM